MRSRSVFFLVAALLGAVLTVPSFADVADRITAKVPFPFMAAEEKFSPGDYVFIVDDPENPHLLTVESADGMKKGEFILADTVSEPHVLQKSEVVFDRYGDEYYLAKVLVVGSDGGLMIPPNEMQKDHTHKGDPKETVHVAAKKGA